MRQRCGEATIESGDAAGNQPMVPSTLSGERPIAQRGSREVSLSTWSPAEERCARRALTRQVAVPQDPGGDGPPRAPALGSGSELLLGRPGRQPMGRLTRRGQRDVAHGPDVGSAECHQQVDVGRPPPDPGQRHQLRAGVVVGQGGHPRQVQPAVRDPRCELGQVSRFLAGQARCGHARLAKRRDRTGVTAPAARIRRRYAASAEVSETCCSRMIRTSVGKLGYAPRAAAAHAARRSRRAAGPARRRRRRRAGAPVRRVEAGSASGDIIAAGHVSS